MRRNRFLLFLNHLRLPYSILKSFALLLAFRNSRHSLFHVDALAPKIITKEEAIGITDEILSLIEEFYS